MRPSYVCVWSNGIAGPDGATRRTFRVTCGYVHGSARAAQKHLAERMADDVGYRSDFAVFRFAPVEDAAAKGGER